MNTTPTIVILAAGLGTRMVSRKAKVLHEAGGLTLIEHVVRSATALTSPENVVVVVGHQADHVRNKIGKFGVQFALQTEQKGTGHALSQCADLVANHSGMVLVAYGDCPLLRADTLRKLIDHHQQNGSAATLITTNLENPTGYGRILCDDSGSVRAIVEEKVATPEQKVIRQINSGIYCFQAAELWKYLPAIEPNPISKEYYLTDIVEVLNRAGHRVSALHHSNADELLGINNKLELVAADRVLRWNKIVELAHAGVTVFAPESVVVDPFVRVGMDTVVHPHAQLLGETEIGEDCFIGTGAIVRDCRIANGVHIAPYTILNSSTVESNASIGPFARLRMDNHVGAGAHIGNFVELKKAHLGPGVKAGHLAYLGDTEIGPETNIGAGTITCNFDGSRKHKTTIGERAFIGSNSTLVAPVDVGNGAYVAAASIVTKTVPDDALAIGRGRQENKKDWAKRRRESRS